MDVFLGQFHFLEGKILRSFYLCILDKRGSACTDLAQNTGSNLAFHQDRLIRPNSQIKLEDKLNPFPESLLEPTSTFDSI